MRYLYWLVVAACLVAVFYVSGQGASDLTLVGCWFVALGWGMAALLLGQLERAHNGWERTIDRWKEHSH